MDYGFNPTVVSSFQNVVPKRGININGVSSASIDNYGRIYATYMSGGKVPTPKTYLLSDNLSAVNIIWYICKYKGEDNENNNIDVTDGYIRLGYRDNYIYISKQKIMNGYNLWNGLINLGINLGIDGYKSKLNTCLKEIFSNSITTDNIEYIYYSFRSYDEDVLKTIDGYSMEGLESRYK